METWEQLLIDVPGNALWLYLGLVVLELGIEFRSRVRTYRLKDTLCSLATGTTYLGTQLLMKGVGFGALVFVHQFAIIDLGSSWLSFAACYVVVDLIFYWHHRILHEVRLGWAAHVVHHSSEQYNLGSTSFRQTFMEAVYEPWFYLPAALMFDPVMVLVAFEINVVYMFWPHTQRIRRLHPAIEWLFTTPSHHRVHHARNVPYLDKNYGGTFIVWDRLFGTFAAERETPEFGILKQLGHHNPLKVLLQSWADLARDLWHARGIVNKLGYLLMPPGWAPDGTGLTSRQIQAEHQRSSS